MSSLNGLVLTRAALKSLERVPFKTRAQLIKKAKALILNPHPRGSKPLKGVKTPGDEVVYRQRFGDHRILYLVRKPGGVIILDIGNRKDVYRGLS